MVVEAAGVRVRTKEAEAVRQVLQRAGVIAEALVPDRIGEEVVFPVRTTETDVRHILRVVAPGQAYAFLEVHGFDEREARARSYRDVIDGVTAAEKELLPKSFDVVGQIAVIKVPDELRHRRAEIGEAILSTRSDLRTVAHDDGVVGPYRVRNLTVIAGQDSLVSRYKEHGILLDVPLDKAYFSPRLATERKRVAGRVRSGDHVLDMFAGVGALVCLIGRTRAPGRVVAIDINPDAIDALRRNVANCRLHAPVDVRLGDAREVSPRSGSFHHVVMNLPHGAHEFLDVAYRAARDDGEIHLYAMLERTDVDTFVAERIDELVGFAATAGRPTAWRLLETRHVRNYGPTMDGLGFTFVGPQHG